MCLAVPARIMEIHGNKATVEMAGVVRETSIMMLPGARVGDYVIIHAGYAIEKLDEEEAQRTVELFKMMESLGAEETKN
ncbi:MAG TPA: HypC/HybG/HupF family hydrogenase formation chaperone [Chloroflexota bacterium]|nr:HypC/HybG/HupF family hydrogenase formation chaperone [Chloroflexota bacterium]